MPRVIRGGMEESFLHKKSRFTRVLTTYPLYAVVHQELDLIDLSDLVKALTLLAAAAVDASSDQRRHGGVLPVQEQQLHPRADHVPPVRGGPRQAGPGSTPMICSVLQGSNIAGCCCS